MVKPSTELGVLKNLVFQAEGTLSNPALPEGSSKRAHELLKLALAVTDDLLAQSKLTAAASILGHEGGRATAKRYGEDHLCELAAQRKRYAGGRTKKTAE